MADRSRVHRNLKSAIAAIALSLGGTLLAGQSQSETLGDTLAYTYNNSGLLEQNRALLRAADEDVVQAAAALRPVISWSATAGSSYPRAPGQNLLSANVQISGELLLYDNGASDYAVNALKETVLGTRQSLLAVEQDVLLRAVQAYVNVRREAQFVDLRRNNVRLLREELQAARDRFELGEITRTDVSLGEARLASAQSLLASAEGNLAQAKQEFVAAVGRQPGNLAPVDPARIRDSASQAVSYAERNHPAIREVQHSIAAAELNIRRAEANMSPKVNLRGSLSVDDELNDSGNVSITASGPLYTGGLQSSQLRQFIARRDATRANLHVVVANVRQSVQNRYAQLDIARANIRAFDQQVAAQQAVFNGVREENRLGTRTVIDLLNAEQELLDARANRLSARSDEVLSTYAVLASMGLLTAQNLGLNVELYDPSAYYNLVKSGPEASPQGQALDRVLKAIGAE